MKTMFKFENVLVKTEGRRDTFVSAEKAERMVKEGRAVRVDRCTIFVKLNKEQFRKSILERDNYICAYCGSFGNTIDHVFPRSKGGLSTPLNCVCACLKCNNEKADRTDIKPLTFSYKSVII